MVPSAGSDSGKNSLLKTSALAMPKIRKSYHSTAVPVTLEMTMRIIAVVCSSWLSMSGARPAMLMMCPELICSRMRCNCKMEVSEMLACDGTNAAHSAPESSARP
jgi:hypothetical protein